MIFLWLLLFTRKTLPQAKVWCSTHPHSPARLVVECHVSPQDIGLVKKRMRANFQIDAFNYNEWSLVVRTRFVVAERTLFQLLHDKADDWLNPALGPD